MRVFVILIMFGQSMNAAVNHVRQYDGQSAYLIQHHDAHGNHHGSFEGKNPPVLNQLKALARIFPSVNYFILFISDGMYIMVAFGYIRHWNRQLDTQLNPSRGP